MIIKIIAVGRTTEKAAEVLVNEYTKRLGNYARVSWHYVELPSTFSSQAASKVKAEEWIRIQKLIPSGAYVVLLDETGKEFTSTEFASHIQKIMNAGTKELIFVIGGAYGFAEGAYTKANEKMALSKMTFTHQLVRVIFIEQLYRAHTILKGERYHH